MLNVPEDIFVEMRADRDRQGYWREEESVEGSPLTEFWIKRLAEWYHVEPNNVCMMCGAQVEMQIMKNTGLCSENCRKERDHDWQPFRGGAAVP
jgi:hypothetical protein